VNLYHPLRRASRRGVPQSRLVRTEVSNKAIETDHFDRISEETC
jgi:hypothetical protein